MKKNNLFVVKDRKDVIRDYKVAKNNLKRFIKIEEEIKNHRGKVLIDVRLGTTNKKFKTAKTILWFLKEVLENEVVRTETILEDLGISLDKEEQGKETGNKNGISTCI